MASLMIQLVIVVTAIVMENSNAAVSTNSPPNPPMNGTSTNVSAVPVWATAVILPKGSGNGEAPDSSHHKRLDDQSAYLFQRINDRLTAQMALDEQQLRRMENLEYRMTRLESQNLDRVEGIRSNVADMSHRLKDLEREFESTKTVLDLLHQDAVGLRRGQAQIRREVLKASESKVKIDGSENAKESGDYDLLNKFQAIMPAVYSVLGSIGSLQVEMSTLRENITQIANMTRYMTGLSRHLVTKDYINILLADAKRESASPAKALLSPQLQLLLMSSDFMAPRKSNEYPEDCAQVLLKMSLEQQTPKKGKDDSQSGIYLIQPKWSSHPFFVYCDMETRGGGWTVFQNRYEGTVDFFRGWQDYKNGFGNLVGEHWLGLEKLHLLTSFKINELLIELEDFENESAFAKFSAFAISSEVEGYQISVLGAYEGSAGDSFSYHVGMKFSTHDVDKDLWEDGSCAQSRSGAWWYQGCETSNLNGRYLSGYLPPDYERQGIYWQDWHGPQYSLMKTRMAIRPLEKAILPKEKGSSENMSPSG